MLMRYNYPLLLIIVGSADFLTSVS